MKSIDKIRETVQRNVVHLAIQVLQGCVGLENIGKSACTLQAKLLICILLIMYENEVEEELTSNVQDAQGMVVL